MLKMVNTKKVLSTMVAVIMLLGSFAVVSADSILINPAETAVYLNGDFYGTSAVVEGNIYSVSGDIEFNNAGDNEVSGNIYLNENKEFKIPNGYNPEFSHRVIRHSNTEFNAPEVTFMTANEIDSEIKNREALITTGYDSNNQTTITESTYCDKLEIYIGLTVDVSEGDIYIVADKIVFGANGYIQLEGDGNLFLFINGDLSMGSSATIEGNNNADIKTHIFVKGNVNLTNNGEQVEMHANIYANGNNIDVNLNKLYGNIVSNNAKNFKMSWGGGSIYGTVYTPAADARISSDNVINGRIVADTLQLTGTGKIAYDERYSTLTMPGQSAAPKYTLTVDVNPAEGGSVTPSYIEADEGETVTLSVTANEGYKFAGFTSADSSNLPDEDGNITITENISLTANFEPVSLPSTPDMDIPEGESLLINFPYAYLYGNEDGTVGADDYIKREEAVALIYRLLKQDNKIGGFTRGSVEEYTNIESGRWSRSALEYMKYIGVYTTSYIGAETYIERGEVAKIITFALRIRPDDSKTINFDDLPRDNQYYHYIKALADIGVLEGYEGYVKPDEKMTRAEFVAMVNRLIGRQKNHEVIDEMNPYPDLSTGIWYYNDIMRASFGYYDEYDEQGIYRIDPEGKPDRYTIDYN